MSEEQNTIFYKVPQLGFCIKSTPQHFLQPLVLPSQQTANEDGKGHPRILSNVAASSTSKAAGLPDDSSCSKAMTMGAVATAVRNYPGQLISSRTEITCSQALRVSSPPTGLLPILSPSRQANRSSSTPSPYLDISSAINAINISNGFPAQHSCPRTPGSPGCLSPLHPNRCSQQVAVQTHGGGNGDEAGVVSPAAVCSTGRVVGSPSSSKVKSSKARAAAAGEACIENSNRQLTNVDCNVSSVPTQQQWQTPVQGHFPPSSHAAGKAARAQRHRRDWDSCTNLPIEPSFDDALRAWQQALEQGLYGPMFLGSWDAVSSGHITAATAAAHSIPNIAASLSRNRLAAAISPKVAAMPSVFQGSGEEAVQALEQLVLHKLVARPHLTLLQLQRGIQAVSGLETQYQLAAIGVMLSAGCWMAAMQVAYSELSVLAEVLSQMRTIIETGLQWDDQLAAATWHWSAVDRELFMRSFKGLGLISQYKQLRKQLSRLHCGGSNSSNNRLVVGHLPALEPPAAAAAAAAACQTGAADGDAPVTAFSSNGRINNDHPELARAEHVMLLSVIDSYLAGIDAALTAQATAAAETSELEQPRYSVLHIVDEPQHAGINSIAELAEADTVAEDCKAEMLDTLKISSDWKILASLTEKGACDQPYQPQQKEQGAAAHSVVVNMQLASTVQQNPVTNAAVAGHGFAGHTHADGASRKPTRRQKHECPDGRPAGVDTFSIKSVPAEAVAVAVGSDVTLSSNTSSSSYYSRRSQSASDHVTVVNGSKQPAHRTGDVVNSAAASAAMTSRAGGQQRSSPGASVLASKVLAMQQTKPEEAGKQSLLDSQPSRAQKQEHSLQDDLQAELRVAEQPLMVPAGSSGDHVAHHVAQRALRQHATEPVEQPAPPAEPTKRTQPAEQLRAAQQAGVVKGSAAAESAVSARQATTVPQEHGAHQMVSAGQTEALEKAAALTAQAMPIVPASAVEQVILANPAVAAPSTEQAAQEQEEGQPLATTTEAGQRSQELAAAVTGRLQHCQALEGQLLQNRADWQLETAAVLQNKLPEQQPKQHIAQQLEQQGGGQPGQQLQEQLQLSCLLQPEQLPVSQESMQKSVEVQTAAAAQVQAPEEMSLQQEQQEQQEQASMMQEAEQESQLQQTSLCRNSMPGPAEEQQQKRHESMSQQGEVELQRSESLPAAGFTYSGMREAQSTSELHAVAEEAAEAKTDKLFDLGNLAKETSSKSLGLHSAAVSSLQNTVTMEDGTQDMHCKETLASTAVTAATDGAVTAVGRVSKEQQQPQAPSQPCSRPQSHQSSHRSSLDQSRPGSAQVYCMNISHALESEGLPDMASRSRPASAAAVDDTVGSSLSRPGSSRSVRSQYAANHDVGGHRVVCGSRPSSAAAAAAGYNGSRPPSASSSEATEAGLQRLRDSCAEQRRSIEVIAQSIMADNTSRTAAAADCQPAASVFSSQGVSSPRGSRSPRPWSAGKSNLGSRPQSSHIGSTLSAAGLLVADNQLQLTAVQLDQGSTPVSARLRQISTPAGSGSQLQRVPEEDSRMQLTWEKSRDNGMDSLHPAADILDVSVAPAAEHPLKKQNGTATTGSPASWVQSTEKRLPEELQRTMQLFQQRLQQTALMAQQLLAQQVGGQAAQQSSRSSDSTPASAAAAASGSLGGGRPSSASVKTAGLSSRLLVGVQAAGLGSGCETGIKLTPRRLAALGVEGDPAAEEVAEYARYLGIDPDQDADLMYIAELAMTAPCPEGWTIHLDNDGNEFFCNTNSQASTYEHPMDQYYRQLYQQKKREKQPTLEPEELGIFNTQAAAHV